MERIKINFIACAFMCSTLLMGCGNNDERMQNPMQEERSEPRPIAQQEARQTNPNTPGKQAGEGDVDASITGSEIGGREMTPSQSIVQNIASEPGVTTFASAIRKAEMNKILNSTGPYTVFAPNNESFEALPNGTLDDLMKDENEQQLKNLLSSHIVAGKITSENLQDGAILKTIGGKQLKVTKSGTDTMVNGAKVEMADNMSANGVIHVIDKVLMPEER